MAVKIRTCRTIFKKTCFDVSKLTAIDRIRSIPAKIQNINKQHEEPEIVLSFLFYIKWISNGSRHFESSKSKQ